MKKKSKKTKYVDPPLKWNPGAHKYEVDLPLVRKSKKTKKEPETSAWKVIVVLIILLLLTGIESWIIARWF